MNREERDAIEDEKNRRRTAMWASYRAAQAAGYRTPEPRFPVIMTDAGPIDSAEKLRSIAQSKEVCEIQLSYKQALVETEPYDPDFKNDGSKKGRLVRYGYVWGWDEIERVKAKTTGNDHAVIWFDGQQIVAWEAHGMRSADQEPSQPQ